MLAQRAYITDADWHGIYDRCLPVGNTARVEIGNNVWIGDNAIVCKGVTIGENSIVGAGAVVTRSIPENSIVVGNPAEVVKKLDPSRGIRTRKEMFTNYEEKLRLLDKADRDQLKDNTLWGWLKHMLAPTPSRQD